MLNELIGLLYKNFKLQLRTPCATLFQITMPIFCVLISFTLQKLAFTLSHQDISPSNITLPVSFVVPLNIPDDVPYYKEFFKPWSCLKINKFGFVEGVPKEEKDFVYEKLFFDNSKVNYRKSFCDDKRTKTQTVAPFFNETYVKKFEDMNEDILKNEFPTLLEHFDKSKIQFNPIPTDGYFLFSKINANKIAATLMSNNMNNQFYHRGNMQTQMIFEGQLVFLSDSVTK